jgi:hypothetical protein
MNGRRTGDAAALHDRKRTPARCRHLLPVERIAAIERLWRIIQIDTTKLGWIDSIGHHMHAIAAPGRSIGWKRPRDGDASGNRIRSGEAAA